MAKARRTNKQSRNLVDEAPEVEVPEGATAIYDGDRLVGHTNVEEAVEVGPWVTSEVSSASLPYGFDYGEGKTGEQEASGVMMLAALVAVAFSGAFVMGIIVAIILAVS